MPVLCSRLANNPVYLRSGLLVAALLAMGCASSKSPSTGMSTPAPGAAPYEVTEANVHRLLFDISDDSMLGRGTGAEGTRRASRYIAGEMRKIGLEPAGDSGYFQRVPLLRKGNISLAKSWDEFNATSPDKRVVDVNVVGILRGSDPTARDSVVLIDAHYDHLGYKPGATGDSVFNGADDDASGVVAVLEIARVMASGPKPRRSVIFLLTTGEELGLLGTRWYVQNPVVPLEKTVANLEFEMIGRPDSLAGGSGKVWLTGFERTTMGAMFKAAGLDIVADPRPAQSFYTRSDNIAFARRGIPAHVMSTFNMHTDYHGLKDEADRANIPHMTAVIRAGAKGAALLANGPVPTWNPGGRP